MLISNLVLEIHTRRGRNVAFHCFYDVIGYEMQLMKRISSL